MRSKEETVINYMYQEKSMSVLITNPFEIFLLQRNNFQKGCLWMIPFSVLIPGSIINQNNMAYILTLF